MTGCISNLARPCEPRPSARGANQVVAPTAAAGDPGGSWSLTQCQWGCNSQPGGQANPIVVDGNGDSSGQSTTRCWNGKLCSMAESPAVGAWPTPQCVKVKTGGSSNNDGYVRTAVVVAGDTHTEYQAY